MSKLPDGWDVGRFGDIVSVIRGVTFPASSKVNEPSHDVIACLRTAHIQDRLKWDDVYFIPKRFMRKDEQITRRNDILMSMANSASLVGKVCINESDETACFGAFLAAIRCEQINFKYAYYFLRSASTLANLRAGASQTTNIANISVSELEKLEVPLAPLGEQKRIALTLDALLAQVDAIRARIDAIPGIIKRFRESVLRDAVSGRLTEAWRSAHPEMTAQRLLHDFSPLPPPPRYKSRSDAHIMGVCATSIGKPKSPLVEAWEWVPLVQIARMESGHTPSRDVSSYWNGDIPWIGIKDARANHEGTIYSTQQSTNQSGLDNSAARLLPAGTVCISRTASVGYVVKMGVPMATSQDFVNWVPTQYVDAEWLKWLFVAEKESLFRFGKGSTHTTIYFPEWLSLHIALPHIDEQIEIARRVQELLALADNMVERVNDAKKRIDALTQSILAKAFRGELVPQDPNDEPASVLLEHIRAQRAAAPKPKRGRKAADN